MIVVEDYPEPQVNLDLTGGDHSISGLARFGGHKPILT